MIHSEELHNANTCQRQISTVHIRLKKISSQRLLTIKHFKFTICFKQHFTIHTMFINMMVVVFQ